MRGAPSAAAFLCLLATVASLARAQTLNLDPVGPSTNSWGIAAAFTADALEAQAEKIDQGPDQGPAEKLRSALRRYAAAMLRSGKEAGEPGAAQIVAGRTLALRMAALDRALNAGRSQGPFGDADLFLDVASAISVGPEKIPLDPSSMDRMTRDALAPLLQSLSGSQLGGGWGRMENVPAAVDSPSPLADLARNAGLEAGPVTALARLDDKIKAAAAWPAYEPSVRVTRLNVARAIWLASEKSPGWLGAPARAAVQAQLESAAAELATDRGDRPAGPLYGPADPMRRAADRVRVLALLADLAELADRAEPKAATRDLRLSLTEIAASRDQLSNKPMDLGAAPGLADRLGSVREVLREFVEPRSQGNAPAPAGAPARRVDESMVVRQLRPAVRPLDGAARDATGEFLEALARVVRSDRGYSDPAYAAAYRAARDRVLAAETTALISVYLGESKAAPGTKAAPERTLRDDVKVIGERLLTVAREVTLADKAASATNELADIAEGARAWWELGPQGSLRKLAQSPDLTRGFSLACAGDDAALWAWIDKARATWADEEAKRKSGEGRAATGAHVRLLAAHEVVRMALAAAAAEFMSSTSTPEDDGVGGGALNRWPGWELSAGATRVLTSGAAERSGAIVRNLLAGNAGAARKDARANDGEAAVGLALGALELKAMGAGLTPVPNGAAAALGQIAIGPPDMDRSWESRRRMDMARASAWAEELAAAVKRGDDDARKSINATLVAALQSLAARGAN